MEASDRPKEAKYLLEGGEIQNGNSRVHNGSLTQGDWSSLMAYVYPTMAILHKVIQKICQCNCIIIRIVQAGQGCPGFGSCACF